MKIKQKIKILLTVLYSGVQIGSASEFDVIDLPSPSLNERNNVEPIAVITHCMGLPIDECLKILTKEKSESNPWGGVSAHYFVPQVNGLEAIDAISGLYPDLNQTITLKYPQEVPVFRIVPDNKRAWHAGVSSFSNWNELAGCNLGLNSCTIGIEFHAPDYAKDGNMFHFTAYTAAQQKTGLALIEQILKNNPTIKPSHILGHSDISFDRDPPKTDPGPFFFWKNLFDKGYGYMPVSQSLQKPIEDYNVQWVQEKLLKIGYKACPQNNQLDTHTQSAIKAYQMHFMTDANGSIQTNGGIDIPLIESLLGFEQNYQLSL